MLYRVGTAQDISSLPLSLPENVYEELLRCTLILDREYGDNRDYLQSGGYSLIAENKDDLLSAKKIIDYDCHYPEWVDKLDGYVAALFLMNDDYSIVLFSPQTITPQVILDEMEDIGK